MKFNSYLLSSPLEQFEVTPLLNLDAPILDSYNIALTNFGLYSFLVVFLVISLHLVANNEGKLVPSYWSISLESLYASILTMVKSQIGSSNEKYLPFIYSLFVYILIANLVSNVPYNYSIATSVVFTLGLSFTIFLGVTLLGLFIHKIKFFSFFVPSGTPLPLVPLLVNIEFVSYLARAFSLGVRLFANLTAGHALLNILSGLLTKLFTSSVPMFLAAILPFILFVSLCGLEIAVSLIQAYVFCILTCSYIKDVIYLH